MDPSQLPPEAQQKVKQFNPIDLNRTVIALPLLRDMEADLERIKALNLDHATLDRFNAAIEFDPSFPGGPGAALNAVRALVEAASKAVLATSSSRLTLATDEFRAREQARHRELEDAIAAHEIAPPTVLPTGAAYSLARLHGSVIRRLQAEGDRQRRRDASPPVPFQRIHPQRFEIIIDLNLEHRGGRAAARQWVIDNMSAAKAEAQVRDAGQGIHFEKDQIGTQYLSARLEARAIQRLVELDIEHAKAEMARVAAEARKTADDARKASDRPDAPPGPAPQWEPGRFRAIYHVWPDFEVSACINKSIATVKCDAAQNAFTAIGNGVTWAVMDSGIRADHPHFKKHDNVDTTSTMHKDFTVDGGGPFEDLNGHGTHVAGIIAGQWPPPGPEQPRAVAISRALKAGTKDVELQRTELEMISGMAPRCKLVSLRVLDEDGKGSVSNLIAAINHIQEINGFGRRLLIHGVNMSVGYTFEPEWFACGQSPLCTEVDRLVKSGVVVVVAAGNTGYGTLKTTIGATAAGMALTINDPGNAELAVTVGSTHRDKPHMYGVSYFSSKGPTGDGRLKPDLVAPGEKIISCATGALKEDVAKDQECHYVETSGTSMAAPHVSGAIAAFLSVRTEFVGKPEQVKQIFLSTCTDLQRDRYFQGAGLVDLMRAIQAV